MVEGAVDGAEKDPGFFAALRMTKETAVRYLVLNAGFAKLSCKGEDEGEGPYTARYCVRFKILPLPRLTIQ